MLASHAVFDAGTCHHRRKVKFVPILIAWLAVAQSCKATPPTAPDPTLLGMAILYSLPNEPEFGSGSFYAFTVDSDGGYTDVTPLVQWSSSDPVLTDIAPTLSTVGRVISLRSVGTARILATYQGVAGELSLTRQPFPLQTTMLLSGRAELRGIGATMQLQDEMLSRFERVTNVATWTSTDPAVATVEQGRVTARSVGTTEVRASYQGASRAYVMSVLPGRLEIASSESRRRTFSPTGIGVGKRTLLRP